MTLTLVLAILAADCIIPPYAATEEERACNTDNDCTLASDACRSCDGYIPVNKAAYNQVTMADLQKRLDAKCAKRCPTCGPETVEVKCIDHLCSAKKLKKKAAAPQPAPKPEQPAQPAPKQ